MVITPQLVQDIFEECPVVAEIYNKTVPKEVWTLFILIAFLYIEERVLLSSQKRSSGNDTFNQNYSQLDIKLLFDRQLLNM